MKRLIPLPSHSTRRVFTSCLLSFLIFMTPLASLAASIKQTASPNARSIRQETAATKAQVKTDNASQLSPTSFFNLLTPQAAPVATASNNHLPGIFSSLMPLNPSIAAQKVDSFAAGDDVDGDGKADPGDKITYNVTITDTVADAAGVAFSDTVHPHTTFLPATLNASPLAFDDHYDTLANTLLEVGPVGTPSNRPKVTVTGNVLSNDVDFLGDAAPTLKTPFPTASTAGGIVTMDSSGHFSFTPKEGFTGDDTFTYTITDDGADAIAGNADDLTNTGTVTITVNAQRIWYVDNTAAPGGLGRSTDPFDTLLEAQAVATTAGDTIYVFTGNGTTSGQNSGYTIQANNQRFLGEGVQLDVPVSVNGGPNPTVLRPAGTAPHIGNSGGNGVTVTDKSGISIRGFNIVGSTNGVAVTMNAPGGGVTISNNVLSGTGANAIDVTTTATTTGGGSVTINTNSITGAGAEGIDINASGTGTLVADVQNNGLTATGNAFDARTTAGALQLNFSNNPGIVSGGSGIDISGLSGGTLTITGFANNSIAGSTGINGISIHTATFDAVPGGGINPIAAGTTTIGAAGAGNGVGGNGLVLINTTGTLPFTDLDIWADGGNGLDVTGINAATTGITVGANVGTINATNGSAVKIGGATIDLQLVSISSNNATTGGVSLGAGSGVNGTFSAGSTSTITNATGDDFIVGSGTANITYDGPITSNNGNSVDVNGHTGGAVIFNGAINDTGAGISLTSNTGATITFKGGVVASTGTNPAFTATGGGTVNVCNENPCNPNANGALVNTLTTTTGTALNVANTFIGLNKLEFKSITAGTVASGPTTSGIILNATGTTVGTHGSLVVTGDGNSSLGGNNSGGIIQKATQYGISLTSTLSPSFTNMNIHDIGRNGIDGFGVKNFTFANGNIATCGTASIAGDFEVNNIAFVDRSGANDNTLDGTVSITNSTITDPERNAIYIETWAGTIDSLTISNNTLSGGTTNARILNAIGVFSQGSASGTGSITTATIQNNNISDFRFFDTAPAIDVWIGGNGIRVVGGNPNAASTSATLGTVANPIVISGNDIDNIGSNMIAVTFAGKQGLSNFTIQNNGTNADKMTNAEGNGISVFFGGNGTFNALVDNNYIDNIDQGGNPSGSKGIAVQSDFGLGANTDVTNSNITVSNNTISNTSGDGIQATGINNAGTFNVRVVNNNITTVPDLDARYGIRVQQSNSGTQPTLNLEINGNTTQGAFNAFHVLGNGIGVRKQDPYQFGIEGLSPTPTDTPQAYINSQNPAGHGTDKLAGTGFIAQNVALYKSENNQQEYTARVDSELQNSNGLVNSLLAYLNINPNFATIPADTIQTAKPSQAMAGGNLLDSMLALMKENSQTTSPPVNHNDSESSEASAASLYTADASVHTNDQPVAASLVAVSAPSSKSNNSVALSHASSQSVKAVKASANKGRNAAQLNHSVRTRSSATAATLMPSGEIVNVTIGALPTGKSVVIQFKVQLDAPPNLAPADLVGGAHVSNQGTVNYTSGPVGGVLTDDPTPAGTTDPTVTPVDLYDSQTNIISSNNNSSQGESITFTATVIKNQTPPPTVPGGTDPTGTVQFFDGANPITCDENGGNSTQPLTSGVATCTTSGLSPGAGKTIKAQYNGDGNFDTSFGTVSQTVTACSLNPVVTSTANSGLNTLRDAVTNICNAPNNNITFNLGAGAHTITLLTELPIAKSVTISNTVSGTNGPLTISGGGTVRVFNIASTASTVGLFNLTIANGSAATGGAILNDSSQLTIYNSTLSGNAASTDGGAIANIGTGTLTITNSTISGNRAAGNGGGIHSLGTATLKNVTITDNHSDNDNNASGAGGGINVAGGTFTIHNTIVAGNFKGSGTTTADDVNNNLGGSSSFSLIGVGGGLGSTNNNQTGVSMSSLRLGPLASNGGATQTHALLSGSLALDAGDNSLVTGPPFSGPPFTDQRGTGFTRIADAADAGTTQTVDIGAFEADPSVEDISDKTTTEDTAVPQFSFGVGDAASAFTSITAVATTNPALVSSLTIGAGANSSLRTLDIVPAANQSGTATITVTVTKTINGSPVSMSDTFVLTVGEVNDAPIAGNDTLTSVAEDSGQRTVSFSTLLANDSPPAVENTQTISVISVSNAVGGTATIDIPNSQVLFTPNADFNGTASFDYTITDNGTTNGAPDPKTATATASFTVTEVNDVPVPANDTLTGVAEDSGQTIIPFSAVTANDNKGAANESGQTLTVSSISNLVGGTFILDTVNSRVLFTPNADFNGTASFDYKITDNGTTNSVSDPKTSVGSATASIPVTEVNDAPTAVGEGISSIAEDSGQRIIPYSDILGNDIKGPANESGQSLVVKTVSSPVGGTVTNDLANSRVLFTPTADFNGAASFQYTVEDNGTTNGANDFKTSANTVTTTFTITEVNDTPDAVDDALSSVAEDSGLRTISIASLTGNDSKGAANESGQTLTFALVAASEVGGTVTINGANVEFTPTADYNGPASFQYKITDNGTTNGVSDPKNDTATVSFTVTEVNDAPTPANDTLTNVAEDSGLRVIPFTDLTGNDSKGPANESGQTLIVKTVGSAGGGTAQINGTNVEFTPTANFSGAASFQYTIEDNGTTAGAADPKTSVGFATVSFTITDENDAPVNTAPGAVTTPQNTVFTFAGGSQISIADIDAGASAVQVSLTATNGTISLSGIAGLSFTTGDGTNDTQMVFTGTVAAINTALNNLKFTPTTNFNGGATLQIVTNDQGNTGNGGAKSDTDTVNITVDPLQAIYINEVLFNPPGTDAPNEYIELRGPASTMIAAGTYLVAVDGDSGNVGDVTVTLNLSGLSFGPNGFLVILQQGNTYTTAAGEPVHTGATTGFGGLPGSIFVADSGATDLENDSVTFMLIQTGTAPSLTDDVDSDNNGTPDGAVYAGWNVRDSVGILDGTSTSDRAYGAINFSNNTGTNGTATGTTILVGFTAGYVGRIGDSTGSTAADWVASVPAGAQPNFTLGNSSSTEPSGFANKPLNHIGASNFVNLPPVNSVPASVNAVEDTTFTFNGGNTISISDPDANAGAVKVTLTATNGTISLSGTAGLTFSPVSGSNDGVNDTTLNFTGTTTAINTALNGMTFTPTTNFFGAASLQIVTDDQGNTGVGGAKTDTDSTTINVGGINDAPTLDALGNATINEDASAQNVNLSGITAGPGESQTLVVTAASSNTGIIPNPTVTYATPSSTGSLSYTPVANKNGGPVTITVTVTDNGGTAGGGIDSFQRTFTVNVTAVNDAPSFQIPSAPPSVNEDASAQTVNSFATNFQPGPPAATDESGQTLVGYTVTPNGTTGNLTFTSTPAISNAGTLTYTPTGNTSGTATFNVTAKDNGGTANGGQDTSAPVSFTITVTGQNDAPVLDNTGNMTLSAINEDNVSNSGTLVSGIIASAEPPDRITDVDASALEGIAVTGVDNANGTWQFTIDNGTNWTPFGAPSVTTARLLAANANTRVRFVPAANFSGTVNTGITFRAWDQTSGTNGNTADPSTNGGTTAFSTATETASITVNPVNDAPTANAQTVGTNEDTPLGIVLTGSDMETAPGALTFNVTVLPLHGTLTGTGANRTYTPNPDYNGADSFKFTVTDTGDGSSPALTSAEATVSITVGAVNDAPVNTIPGAQSATRNTDFTFNAANSNLISIADVDAGAAIVKVTLNATNGKLTLSGTAGLTFTPANSNNDGVNDAQLVFTGTIANINNALNGLVFSPTPGFDGAASIQITTDDQGNTGSGGVLTDTDTINITVNKGGLIAFSSATYTVAESGATATITVSRAGGSSGTTKVDYATSNGTATAGQDYTAASGQLTFGNGETTKTFTVPVLEDALNEAPETINLTLSNAQGSGDLGPQATAVLTITDNDPTPSLSINDVTVTEGNSGTVNATFTVTLSAISGQQVTVNYQTADGTATAPSDYTAIPSTLLTFNQGETTKTITVAVNGDVLAEVDETFFVNLSGATNASISDNQGVGNIVSDDTPVIQFSASTYSVNEDGLRVTITVNRLGDISKVARIDYATSDPSGLTNCSVVTGNASSRCDYATSVGTVRFAANEGSRTISIPIVNDVYVEGPESFTITLSNAVGGDLGSPSVATITINDNDNGGAPNPIDNNAFFIRQLYIDFLGREPDPPGLAGWLQILNNCQPGDQSCDRVHIAEGFARSQEFQERGYFIYRVYRASLGRKPNYAEFIPDMAKVSGFLNGQDLEANKQAFIEEFITRTEFRGKYDALDNIGYVNALEQTALVTLPNKQALINELNAGTKTRAQVLRAVIETAEVYAKNVNEAFVVMEYFGFLRRDPDAAYLVWIDMFNHSNDYRLVINGFVNSLEYRFRFGPN